MNWLSNTNITDGSTHRPSTTNPTDGSTHRPSTTNSTGWSTPRSTKGISPIIATVFLIAIAVGIAAVVGPSIVRFAKNQAEETTEKSGAEITCSKAGTYIRDAVYNTSSNQLKFRVENTGYQELKNFRVDVIFDNDSSSSYTFRGSDEILPPGSIRWFINDTVYSSNFDQLVIVSSTCPSAARDIVFNSSVSFVS